MRCMEENHAQPDHVCVKISGVQVQFKEDLKTIVSHSRMKLGKSQEDSQAVGTALSELQEQYDNAKGLISETFQSYKSILEAHRVGTVCCYIYFQCAYVIFILLCLNN